MGAAQLVQARRAIGAKNTDRLLHREPVVPGRHRRVRRKDTLAAHLLDIHLGRRAQRAAAQLCLEQRQRQQRSVSFIHVIDVDVQAQRIGHAHAAQTQHNLLLQPIVRIAAIQVIRQPAIPARVLLKIGVQ